MMASAGALNHIGRPSGVMEARASLGTLHATVAGKEVTAHAESEAVRLIGAQKLATLHSHDGHDTMARLLVIEPALHMVEIHHLGVGASVSHLVDFLQPLHFAVAVERVGSQEEFRQH